jgi:hypothetical protein
MAMNASEKARIAGRKEAVKAGAAKGQSAKESRKRYYVQTRVAELEKAGKPVSAEKRKQLRQKFNSGDVSRRGFAAPKKQVKTIEVPKTISPVAKSRPPSGGRYGRTSTMPGSSSSSSSSTSTKKGRSGGGKVYDFARNELLGVDDFGRVGKNLRKGNYGKAAKSAGAGVLELGSTVATIFGIGAGIKGATAAGKAAKLAKGVEGASNLKYYKNLGKVAPKIVGKAAPYKAAPLSKAAKAANLKYYKNLGKPAAKTVTKSAAKTVAKTAKKSVSVVAKRTPRVAKAVAKPMVKSTSKSLTSKAVVKTAVKKVPKKRIK